jgi:hypothetical protein
LVAGPAQEHQLGAEARTHRHQQAVCPNEFRFTGRQVKGPGQDMEHRGRREVADVGQGLPGESERLGRQVQRLLQRVQDTRSTRVSDPALDVAAPQVMAGEERVQLGRQMVPHDVGDPGRQHDPEAGAADVPAHHALGVGEEPAPCPHHGRRPLSQGRVELDVVAHHDHGGGAVAEQPAPDQVRHRVVVALHRERTQLDGQQHRDVARVPDQVVVQPGDARGAGHTAEAEDRDPLDVGPQAEQ